MTRLNELLQRLEARGLRPRRCGKGWIALCPCHEADGRGHRPSLSIGEGRDGRPLLFCFGGCSFKAIADALGLRPEAPPFRGWRATLRLEDEQAWIAELAAKWRLPEDHPRLVAIAKGLGVSPQALAILHVGWNAERQATTWPMRDATGRIVGIRFRKPNGQKLSLKGGKEGLFYSGNLASGEEIWVGEGATDTAALLSLGVSNVVGRPSCTGGVSHVIGLVQRLRPKAVTIIGDGDEPGRDGANRLAAVLRPYVPKVRWGFPPHGVKDVRAWLGRGLTRAELEGSLTECDNATTKP